MSEARASEIEYRIAATGPAVDPSEVETAALAVEVVILWGDRSVLHVAHLSPPRDFTIGDPDARGAASDFAIDGITLGAERLGIVRGAPGSVIAVVPKDAECEVVVDGRTRAVPGGEEITLPHGATATMHLCGFTFVVRATSAGREATRGAETSLRTQLWTAISLGIHGALLAMFYFLPPSASALSLDLVRPDDRLVQYLMTPPATIDEPQPEWLEPSSETAQEGGTGRAHADDSGAMGAHDAPQTTNRYAMEGDSETPTMARDRARDEARDAASAMGALLGATGAWSAPTSPYGADSAAGADPMSALGALMGDQIGTNFGFDGLGLRGTGRGGGGTGLGTIGQGTLGTIGHGAGLGGGDGYGVGVASFHRRVSRVAPRITPGSADVHGSLSREVIQRVIRRHVNEVRFCYEQELSQRPDLAGRVTVSFIISQSGAVSSSALTATTLGNARVESCVVTAVHRWTFPPPDGGGVVGVNYPFLLDSTGGES